MNRKALVVANWKMHGQRTWIKSFIQEFLSLLPKQGLQAEIVVCPPSVYTGPLYEWLQGSVVKLGAQNLYSAEQGAYTGEVSAVMLQDCGCSYVIVGHSERRVLFKESNEDVALKFNAAKMAGLIPILCVGENAKEREAGITEEAIQRQLDAVVSKVGIEKFDGSVVAYEPVWAIGTGNTATPEQAQAVHVFIRKYLANYSRDVASKLLILYGGSVKADNVEALATMKDIDGALVGGASLIAKEFKAICVGFDS